MSRSLPRGGVRRYRRPAVIADVTDDNGRVVAADSPERVNDYLRAILDRVVVKGMTVPARRGPSRSMPALRFEWRDPSLRSPETGDLAPGN